MKSLSESIDWIDKQLGKELDWPNSGSGAQCTDLPAFYMKFHDTAWPGANKAADLWDRTIPGWHKSDVPVVGSVAVWSVKVGSGYGHEALVREIYAGNSFRSLDQNYYGFDLDKGSKASWVKHDMKNVLGFWVPDFTPDPVPATYHPPEPTKVSDKPNDGHYNIKPNETFWGLEEAWGLPHGTLQQLNLNVEPRHLQIGQDIIVPTDKIPEPPKPRTLQIVDGDTFWGIEAHFGWNHGTLQDLNPGVNPRMLQIGQTINIPG